MGKFIIIGTLLFQIGGVSTYCYWFLHEIHDYNKIGANKTTTTQTHCIQTTS